MNTLRDHLIAMSNMVAGIDERARVKAALFVAAEATLSRIREVSPSYDLARGVEQVEAELRDDGSRSAKVPLKTYREEPIAVVPDTPEAL